MRKINSTFITKYLSESGTQLENRDYFGYVEMDEYACYVLADSLDEEENKNSGKIVVESIIQSFMENPSMRKGALHGYIRTAQKKLRTEKDGMRLKASVVAVVTDYLSLRYCAIGNSRFYLMRGDRFLVQSKDQSLTVNLVEEERLEMDKAALHEERNNLSAYLGQEGQPRMKASGKWKLEDGDVFHMLSRGIWEYCNEGELLDACEGAADPQDILDSVEELILAEQSKAIENYTMAVTFIQKIYQNPKKKLTLKKVLLAAIPILVIALTAGVVLYIQHRNKVNDVTAMKEYIESGEEYLKYNNYTKALEHYQEALTLAKKRKQEEKQEIDGQLLLINQILNGDDRLLSQEYQKAMDIYMEALVLSYNNGNVGRTYIEDQLNRTSRFIQVYDLLEAGQAKEDYNDLEGALEEYRKARELAAGLYFNDGKQDAQDKIAAAEEAISLKEQADREVLQQEIDQALKEQTVARELENQSRINDQTNAIELESKGNELLAAKDPQGALIYYETARSIYESLEMAERVEILDNRIAAAKELMNRPAETETDT